MKRILTFLFCLTVSVSLFAQAGLSQGQALKQTTANPTSAKKTCSYCGIELGNITYPWQHETWCPYYKSRSAAGSSSSSSSSSVASQAAAGVAAVAVGSALGNALSNWLNSEPKGDYKRYTTNVPGHTLGYKYDERSGGEKVPDYVVLRDSGKDKLGVWKNAWTYTETMKSDKNYGKMTDYPGQWMIKPKYDFINLRSSGVDSEGYAIGGCVAIVGLKSGKGDNAPMKYGLVEANISWGYGHELIPVKYAGCVAANPENLGWTLLVIMGNPGKDGKMIWGVWRVGKKRKPNQFDKMEAFSVLPEQFEAVTIYQPGYIAASKYGKFGLYDKEGHNLLPHEYASLSVSPTGIVRAQKEEGGKFGVLDLQGKTLVPFDYENVILCNGGTAIYGNGGLYGALLPSGESIPIEYTNIRESFWIKKGGEKVITIYVEKDGISYYRSNGRLIPVRTTLDVEAKEGISFSSWYNEKTAKLKEEFMKKGEFEKEADYQARIADPANLGNFLSSRIPAPVDEYMKQSKHRIVFGTYDTENECFQSYLEESPWDIIRIPVPIDVAPYFKEKRRANITPSELVLLDDYPAIKSMTIAVGGETWRDKDVYYTVRVIF